MTVTVYKLDGSPSCRTVNMLVELIGLETESKIIRPLCGDTMTPEYLEKNPLHTIPIIEDGDFILADSHAIIKYLVSKYGADKQASLYPSDLRIRATVDQRLFFDATTLFMRFRDIMGTIRQNATTVAPQLAANVEEAYGFLETYLSKSKYMATDYVTIADVAAVSTVSTLDLLVPIGDKYPKLREWFEGLQEQEWYKKGNVAGLEMIKGFLSQKLTG